MGKDVKKSVRRHGPSEISVSNSEELGPEWSEFDVGTVLMLLKVWWGYFESNVKLSLRHI